MGDERLFTEIEEYELLTTVFHGVLTEFHCSFYSVNYSVYLSVTQWLRYFLYKYLSVIQGIKPVTYISHAFDMSGF